MKHYRRIPIGYGKSVTLLVELDEYGNYLLTPRQVKKLDRLREAARADTGNDYAPYVTAVSSTERARRARKAAI